MLKIGDVLDNTYEIKSQIGSGSGGIIYRGYHLRMRKPVAIKLMKSEAKGIIDQRSEVDLLKQLKNDHIPQVLDFIIDGNDVYTVMEFVEGSNFKQLITFGRTFSENDVLKYTKQLCAAVKYLHDHNPPIIHSDIKPANIMLKPDDSICLIDFNISTIVSEGGAYSVGGSRGFAAPEQFRKVIDVPVVVDEFHEETRFLGDDDETEFIDGSDSSSGSSLRTKNVSKAYVDIRTDIYGIGSSMYYILTGRVPVTGKTDFRGVKVSSKTQKIIKKCMNPDPAKRYSNVRELEHALSSKGSAGIIAAAAAVLIIGIGAVAVINNNSTAEIESDSYYDDIIASEVTSGPDGEPDVPEDTETVTAETTAESYSTETTAETSSADSGSNTSLAITAEPKANTTAEFCSEEMPFTADDEYSRLSDVKL
ncbi:MAG: serine/threonine-protein kinase, partial [Oscillospiraceae bacterium]